MRTENPHTINGVEGRLFTVKSPGVRNPLCFDNQTWQSRARAVPPEWGYPVRAQMAVNIRHDDQCNNGRNSFSVTAEIFVPGFRNIEAGGQLTDEVRALFPELAPLLRWHLCDTHGPLHYIANTLYWLGYKGHCSASPMNPPNIQHARRCAVWPDLPESMICPAHLRRDAVGTTNRQERGEIARTVTEALEARLPALLAEFIADVESAGLMFVAPELVEV